MHIQTEINHGKLIRLYESTAIDWYREGENDDVRFVNELFLSWIFLVNQLSTCLNDSFANRTL